MTTKDNTKILLILDLDETLVHATPKALNRTADFEVFNYYVYHRPHLEQFLQDIQHDFLVAVWSSASDDYVTEVVAHIFPENYPLEFVWGRSRCTPKRYLPMDLYGNYERSYAEHFNYIKPLKKLKKRGYELERMLIIDDTPHKASDNYGNAIYPKEYLGDHDDDDLKLLLSYLKTLKDVSNVRAIEKRGWRAQIE